VTRSLRVLPVPGLPEVRAGDDLAAMVHERLRLRTGDVLAVTSKVVSKAEGRTRSAGRSEVASQETSRVVARRGAVTIVRTRHGLVLAAAGVDASNVATGKVVALPVDPDASARALRAALWRRSGANVAVVITDTAGRPWRVGQTDIAIGCAGMAPWLDLAGRDDSFGNPLTVTAPAVADEVAAAADLVKGKLRRLPVAVLRDSSIAVLPAGDDGPGAAALVRDPSLDLFGLGARDAVVAAASRRDPLALAAFPRDDGLLPELVGIAASGLDAAGAALRLEQATGPRRSVLGLVRPGGAAAEAALLSLGAAGERLCALAVAHGYRAGVQPGGSLDPATPAWRCVLRIRLELPPLPTP
jgi:coenzyme F420-0:L-glutamate ligase/coenzyme F420-1:gamma-L-glutamate ligase